MKSVRKYWFGLSGLGLCLMAVLLGSLSGCGGHGDPWEHVEGEGPKVLVSFPPLYCFTKNVAGEHAKVLSLVTTVGPHSFSPTAKDVAKAAEADLFLINGLTLDDWVAKITNNSGNPKFRKEKDKNVIAVAEFLPKADEDQPEHKPGQPDAKSVTRIRFGHHGHSHSSHAGHSHGEWDPHAWLGIAPAKFMVEKIRDELIKLDPQHKKEFTENAAKYVQELDEKLQKFGENQFKDKTNKKIIATHDSLKYFARSFGLIIVDNIQPQPGVEASAKDLERLIKICKDEKVRVITVEPQYSKATAETLERQLKDLGVKLVTFDTLETVAPENAHNPDYYVTEMRKNIKTLADALK